MKRATYFIIGILFLAIVLPFSAQAAQLVGNVSKLNGTAQIIREGVISPINVYVGMPLFLHDRVRTADDSALRIDLLDGSILSMGKKADLHLYDFSFLPEEKKRSAFFRMAMGKLRVFAKKLIGFRERDFKVGTPTAVVGVRGTVFLVWVQSDTITKVACFEDEIEVANALRPEEYIVLTKDLMADIIGGAAPSKPVLVTDDQLRDLQKDLEDVPTVPTTTETTEATTIEGTTTEATTTSTTTTTTLPMVEYKPYVFAPTYMPPTVLDFPKFPWPPPKTSTSVVIPPELLKSAIDEVVTLKDVECRLNAALNSCGYSEKSYYWVPDGFAIVTRLEQINPDGTSKESPDRWSVKVDPLDKFDLGFYIKALFKANSGYYRIIVFAVTSEPFAQASRTISRTEAMDWLYTGLNKLPEKTGMKRYSDKHSCTALIYEFERPTVYKKEAVLKSPGRLSAKTHLEKAGLWNTLEHIL